jgi:hypothetical protein
MKDASKRSKKQLENAQGSHEQKTRGRRWNGNYSRLGAGLGAAGLASGLASSHFESLWFWVGSGVEVGWVVSLEGRVDELVVGVECRDNGLLAAVGGRGGLIRTGLACCECARSTCAV